VARRFVTLIDEVYDAGTRIVWTGAAPPLELFEDLFRKTSHVRVDVSADDLTPFDPAGDLRREQSSPIERTLHHGAVTPPGYQDRFRLNEAKYSSKDPTGQSIEEEASNSTDDVVHISKGESAAYTDLNLALQRAASRLIEMSGVAYQPARR
jgi:predicted ATPase